MGSEGNRSRSGGRLGFLDWLRGLAAAQMLFGHTIHSFTRPADQPSGVFQLSQYFGGYAPAVFLFLTGVTFAFLMESSLRKGLSGGERWWRAAKRSGYLLVLAFLFRFQLWLFAWPQSPWWDLFKVDVLNCMGVALLLLSPLALLNAMERTQAALAAGVAIAFGAPIVTAAGVTWMPEGVRAYFVPDLLAFPLFPWGAFIAFGIAAGSVLRAVPREHHDRVMQWSALLGFGLLLLGDWVGRLPYQFYAKSDYWLNSPALTILKLGIVLLLASFAWLWNRIAGEGWSPLRQLGMASLLVYWVHIELVYGRWLGALKGYLSIELAVFAAVLVFAVMVLLAVLKTRWTDLRSLWPQAARPSNAAGD